MEHREYSHDRKICAGGITRGKQTKAHDDDAKVFACSHADEENLALRCGCAAEIEHR
jgi:hypothetical protein